MEDYGFGEDHPFRPVRIQTTIALCESLGLLEGYAFVESEPATDEDLTTVHYTSYMNRMKKAGRGEGDLGEDELEELNQYGIGIQDNPIFEGMHEASARVVGATIRACRLIMNGEAEHALCPSGGLQRRATLWTHCFLALPDASSASNPGFLRSVLQSMFRGGGSTALTTAVHHAQRWAASGFCVYNDVGVAIARLKEGHPDIKIAYVDTDVHHADGVQWMFYGDPDVLTVSMHETGRRLLPGTGYVKERGQGAGHGYSVNVPLQPYTHEDSFIECFESMVPEVVRSFGPDLILSQNGCDAHALDPLADLSVTTRVYEHVPYRVHELAHELCGCCWVRPVGGGGYDIWRVVPRA